jgi:membrane associated rhomboid family serine protease
MQMQFPSMSPLNKGIVITFVALFLLGSILTQSGFALSPLLGLSAHAISSGKIWTLFTYALLPSGFMECLFDGLIFWFIGSELEMMWGQRRYAYFLLTIVFGAALFYLVLSFLFFSQSSVFAFPLHGPAGLASAMCVAYGILFPERTMYFFFFPLQAKWFVILLVGMNLYHGFFSPSGIFAWAQIGSMISGTAWMLIVSNPNLKSVLTDRFNSSGPGAPANKKRKKRKVSHLHIVEDPNAEDDEEGPTYH